MFLFICGNVYCLFWKYFINSNSLTSVVKIIVFTTPGPALNIKNFPQSLWFQRRPENQPSEWLLRVFGLLYETQKVAKMTRKASENRKISGIGFGEPENFRNWVRGTGKWNWIFVSKVWIPCSHIYTYICPVGCLCLRVYMYAPFLCWNGAAAPKGSHFFWDIPRLVYWPVKNKKCHTKKKCTKFTKKKLKIRKIFKRQVDSE